MANESLPLFRLPAELRHQIYREIFFAHVRDPPLLYKGLLERPQKYRRCVRLWIEGDDLLTHRNWLNEISIERGRTDVHAFLRTCKAVHDDAGAFIYDSTLFLLFTSTKYSRRLEQSRRPEQELHHRPLPERLEDRINSLTPWPVNFYGCGRWPPDDKPRWRVGDLGYGYTHLGPKTTLLGHLNSPETAFLRHAKNLRIYGRIRTPDMMALTTIQLRNLGQNLSKCRETIDLRSVSIDFMEPSGRKHVEKELWRHEPSLPPGMFDSFFNMLQTFYPGLADVSCQSGWWLAALRKPALIALKENGKRFYPRIWMKEFWSDLWLGECRKLVDKWAIPWCGECSECVERAQRVEDLEQMPHMDVFDDPD